MAMSGHDEQVIAELERQFPIIGDPMDRRRRRVRQWILVDCIVAIFGLTACLLALVVWWPGAAIAGGAVTVSVASMAHLVTRNRTWLSADTRSILRHAWHQARVVGRGMRRVLGV
jgi:hypothetical protein